MRFTTVLPTGAAILSLLSNGALATPAAAGSSEDMPMETLQQLSGRKPTKNRKLLDEYAQDMQRDPPPRGMIPLPSHVNAAQVPEATQMYAPGYDLNKAPCRIVIYKPTNPIGGTGEQYFMGNVAPGGVARFDGYICKASKDCLRPTCFNMPFGFRYFGRHMRYEHILDFQYGRIDIKEAEDRYQKLQAMEQAQREQDRREAELNPPQSKPKSWWAPLTPWQQ